MAAILTILLPFYPEGKGLVVSGRLQQHRRTYYEKERRWLWVDRTGLPVLSGDFTSPNWWNLFIKQCLTLFNQFKHQTWTLHLGLTTQKSHHDALELGVPPFQTAKLSYQQQRCIHPITHRHLPLGSNAKLQYAKTWKRLYGFIAGSRIKCFDGLRKRNHYPLVN